MFPPLEECELVIFSPFRQSFLLRMYFTLVSYGSWGDFQPIISLGILLKQRNPSYHITIVAPEIFKLAVKRYQIDFSPLPGNPREEFNLEEVKDIIKNLTLDTAAQLEASSFSDGTYLAAALALEKAIFNQRASRSRKIKQVLICTTLSLWFAVPVAEKCQIPLVTLALQPDWPNPHFGSMYYSSQDGLFLRLWRRLQGGSMTPSLGYELLNYIEHFWTGWTFSSRINFSFQHFRKSYFGNIQAGRLNPLWACDSSEVPIICCWSKEMVPMEYGWGSNVHSASYLYDAATEHGKNQSLEDKIVHFLKVEDKRPIIFFGFGSIPMMNGDTIECIVQICMDKGLRGIICGGWSNDAESSFSSQIAKLGLKQKFPVNQFLYIDQVNHGLLFPYCSCIVYHGGSGTTGSVIRAGKPSIVCSIVYDQSFWGSRIESLGIGVHLPYSQLNLDTLSRGLDRVLSKDMAFHAFEFGEKVKLEGKGAKVVDIVEKLLEEGKLVPFSSLNSP